MIIFQRRQWITKNLLYPNLYDNMAEISIIINGVRYDAVQIPISSYGSKSCDLCELSLDECEMLYRCPLSGHYIFKKSSKSFEV